MPEIKKQDVLNKVDELQNGKVQALQQQIAAMPEGEERHLAQLELTSVQEVLGLAKETAINNAAYPAQLARAYYAKRALEEHQPTTVAEIENKADALAKNAKFLEVFGNQMGADNNFKALNSLFDGPRAAHLDGWVRECENAVTRDYGQLFDTLCGDKLQGEARDTAKQHFVNMGKLNEAVRTQDYTKAFTPEQMYEHLTKETLPAEKAAAAENAKFLGEKAKQIERGKKINPTVTNPVGMPKHLDRFAFFFYDYSDAPDAAENNQNTVNQLRSDTPEAKEFQKQFTVECINKMLAVPDDDLCPKTPEQAKASLENHYFAMRGLQEAPNFLANLSQEYQVPEYIREALHHKCSLYIQNVEKYVEQSKIKSEVYEEVSLLAGFDPDLLTGVYGKAAQSGEMDTAVAIMGLLENNHDFSKGRNDQPNREAYDELFLRERDLAPVKEGAVATASDGFSLMPDDVKMPKEPGGWASFWHMFGFYKEEFETYEREKRTYDNWVKAHPRKSFLEDGALRFDANSINAKNLEEDFEKDINLDDVVKDAREDYEKMVNDAFGNLEKQTRNTVNRLDYIMIGPRSLRAVLQEEYLKTHADCKELTESGGSELENYCKESLENGHAYELMAYAELQHISLQYAVLDDKAQLFANGGKVDMKSFNSPSIAKVNPVAHPRLTAKAAEVLANKGMDLKGNMTATERMYLMENSRAALHQMNFWHRVECACDKSAPAISPDNYYGLDNAAFHALTEATMLDPDYNMTPEQIYETVQVDRMADGIKRATEKLLKDTKINDPEMAGDFASVAVEAIHTIKDLMDTYTKGLDLPKDICSPKMRAVSALASTAAALNKGVFQNEKLREAAGKAWAEKHGMDVTNPEDLKKASQNLTVFSNQLVGLNTALEKIREGRMVGCRFCTGNVEHAKEGVGKIFAGEMALKVISAQVKSGKPLSESISLSESKHIESWGRFATDAPTPGNTSQKALHDLCAVENTVDAMKFASYALSGGLARDCQVELAANQSRMDDGLDMGAKFTFTPPQELAQESVVADVVLEETQPADEQEMLV